MEKGDRIGSEAAAFELRADSALSAGFRADNTVGGDDSWLLVSSNTGPGMSEGIKGPLSEKEDKPEAIRDRGASQVEQTGESTSKDSKKRRRALKLLLERRKKEGRENLSTEQESSSSKEARIEEENSALQKENAVLRELLKRIQLSLIHI